MNKAVKERIIYSYVHDYCYDDYTYKPCTLLKIIADKALNCQNCNLGVGDFTCYIGRYKYFK